jgi:RNA polymerase sigma factor (sigma-70 family)
MPDDSDSNLLQRYITDRDEVAFKELVQRHLPFVYATALRRCGGDTHCAQEIAQAVFTDLALRAGKLSQHTALAGWLHTSTRFAASALYRAEHRRRSRETSFSMNLNENTAEPAPDCDRLRAVIDPALDELDAPEREMILLRFFGKKSFGAMGDFFNLSEDAARKRTERALEKLRTRLSRRGITSSSAALGLILANQTIAGVAVPSGLAVTVATTALTNTATSAGSLGLISALLMAHSKPVTIALITLASIASISTAVVAGKIAKQEAVLANLSSEKISSRRSQNDLSETQKAIHAASEKLRRLEAQLPALPLPEEEVSSGSAVLFLRMIQLRFNDPEYVRLERQKLRAQITTSLGYHLAKLNLPPDKLDALKEILVTEEIESVHARFTMVSGNASSNEDTRVALRLSTDAALRELLGESGPEVILRVKGMSSLNRDLSADLRESGHPLTRIQEKKLAGLIYDLIRAPQLGENTSSVFDATSATSEAALSPAENADISQMDEQFTTEQRAAVADYFKFERARSGFEERFASTTTP